MKSWRWSGCRMALAVVLFWCPETVISAERFFVLQSTTSTANSGLLDNILPIFAKESGIEVRVVTVGTGQALKNARNCDGDALLAHSRADEEAFVKDGFGIKRHDVMFNDFVVVGPTADPAGVRRQKTAIAALTAIAKNRALFVSRGDDSGTHKKELSLWRAAAIDVACESGSWYLETGSGMGATLNAGIGMGAYVLTDRATWISFNNKADFDIVLEGDPELFNQYGVIAVSPARCPNVRNDEARAFVNWLVGKKGQAAIAGYRIDRRQLFFPNAVSVR